MPALSRKFLLLVLLLAAGGALAEDVQLTVFTLKDATEVEVISYFSTTQEGVDVYWVTTTTGEKRVLPASEVASKENVLTAVSKLPKYARRRTEAQRRTGREGAARAANEDVQITVFTLEDSTEVEVISYLVTTRKDGDSYSVTTTEGEKRVLLASEVIHQENVRRAFDNLPVYARRKIEAQRKASEEWAARAAAERDEAERDRKAGLLRLVELTKEKAALRAAAAEEEAARNRCARLWDAQQAALARARTAQNSLARARADYDQIGAAVHDLQAATERANQLAEELAQAKASLDQAQARLVEAQRRHAEAQKRFKEDPKELAAQREAPPPPPLPQQEARGRAVADLLDQAAKPATRPGEAGKKADGGGRKGNEKTDNEVE